MNPHRDVFNSFDLGDYLGIKPCCAYKFIRRVCAPRQIGVRGPYRWEFTMEDLIHAYHIYYAQKSV